MEAPSVSISEGAALAYWLYFAHTVLIFEYPEHIAVGTAEDVLVRLLLGLDKLHIRESCRWKEEGSARAAGLPLFRGTPAPEWY